MIFGWFILIYYFKYIELKYLSGFQNCIVFSLQEWRLPSKSFFLDPQQYWEGSYKIGSVHPSVLPSVLLSRHFVGIVWLVFSENLACCWNPMWSCAWNSWIFQENFFPKKLGKWAKNRVFSIYWKTWSLIFTEFDQ